MADVDGFREFVRDRSPALSRHAYLLTGDHQLAEDLLQSALATTYRHWRRVRADNPDAYVRKAMYHLAPRPRQFVSSRSCLLSKGSPRRTLGCRSSLSPSGPQAVGPCTPRKVGVSCDLVNATPSGSMDRLALRYCPNVVTPRPS
jgi:hypothetical protein